MGRPKGVLGVEWGDTLEEAAARLGVACADKSEWEGGQGFETCRDSEHTVAAFGSQAFVRLIGKGGKLEGVELSFRECGDWGRMRDTVREEFGLSTESETDAYQTFWRGEAVRLIRTNAGEGCLLTVAGPRFGRAYSAFTLAQGFGALGGGTRP
jgi:hypothetical protein